MEERLKQEIIELIKSLQNQDSIEIGNSKTGTVKVYCNFEKPLEAEMKIKTAIRQLKENREAVLGEGSK